ncbi:hypothetical protein D9M68_841220 [compost metagenome]
MFHAAAPMPDSTMISRPAVQMPFDVLASTCESLPQRPHAAGEPRLERRLAMAAMPG